MSQDIKQSLPAIKVTGGIAQRVASLKKNGEEEWRKKVARNDPVFEILDSNSKLNFENEKTDCSIWEQKESEADIPTMRRNKGAIRIGTTLDGGSRPGSLGNRLSLLENAQSSWKTKVGEKDVEQHTVAGKMKKMVPSEPTRRPSSMLVATPTTRSRTPTRNEPNATSSVIIDRVKNTPKPRKFQGSPLRKQTTQEIQEELDAEDDANHEENNDGQKLLKNPGDEIENFFTKLTDEKIECSELDFDALVPETSNLLQQKKTVTKAPNRRQRGAKNPIKQLAARTDLKEPELVPDKQRHKSRDDSYNPRAYSKDSVHSHLTAEAKAGLASTEDFSTIQLKRNNTTIPNQDMVPFKTTGCMLLQVKGRRSCQTRLVNPSPLSINSGDAYVLVTRSDIFNWVGEFCNVIERSRSAEVALTIMQKKDLGCKAVNRGVITLEEEKLTKNHFANKLFWQNLGCSEPPEKVGSPGPPEEDEDYETFINDLNLVWSVDSATNQLIPVEQFWGSAPRHEVLQDPNRVLVFDFGSEVYVWNGRSAPFDVRRLGVKLAKDLWEKGLEDTSPVPGHPLIPETSAKRPEWSLLGKVNQNMETILFREKFLNWPDKSRLIKSVTDKDDTRSSKMTNDEDLKFSTDVERNFDIAEMVGWNLEEPNLELEMTFLGRGRSYYDLAERRQYEIETLSVDVWHVSEYDTVELESSVFKAQFHVQDTYVIRWKYKVSLTGRDLKGQPSKHVAVGRERWAYFFWQGSQSGVTEKGASALMTVELDREKGPQIRVDQGSEPAAFLNLWSGCMVVHKGKRNNQSKANKDRLFIVRGETPEEVHCVEVEFQPSSLRSKGCFLFVDNSSIVLWIGQGAPDHAVTNARAAALNLKKNSLEFSCSIIEESEGEESEKISKFIGSRSDYLPFSCPTRDSDPGHSTRLYMMTSVSGDFQVNEIACPFLSKDLPSLMPFNQSELYSADQPGLFLLDAGGDCLWLWQGWWPEIGHETGDTNLSTGSGLIRWHAERRVAMETVQEFRDMKYRDKARSIPMNLVWAGHEPLEFTNLFLAWKEHLDVGTLNLKFVGNSNLEMVLAALSKTTYTWSELQQRPLPDGVDPSRLEKYLSDQDFLAHLGISREDFMKSPRWKQLEIRKARDLF